jgi:hypothetical protein
MKVIVVKGVTGDITKVFTVPDDQAIEYTDGPSPPGIYDIQSDGPKTLTLRKVELDPTTVVTETRTISADFRPTP